MLIIFHIALQGHFVYNELIRKSGIPTSFPSKTTRNGK